MSMIEHRVSALIISPSYGDTKPAFDRIAQAGIPAIQVLRRADDRSDLFPFASFDYHSGARQAAAHLRDAGAHSIAFVGGMENRPIPHERVAGYRQIVAARQGASRVFPGETTRGFGSEAARLIAEKHESVDAALCFNDLIALGMIAGFSELGIVVGRDFRIAGFDDLEERAQTWPPLTSVRCDVAAFGQRIARVLLRWLLDGERPPPEYRARTRLIARASTLGVPCGRR